jgi:4-amino-4-deoxy-L-arabinose transferase-like glycosyltransferase
VLTWGRGTSAFLGTAVVFLVFQIGMRWGARHALLGAGLMAVSPTHVAASRAIGHESPLTFFAALTLLLSLVAIERGRPRAFAAAGAAAGLAAASHYAGALLIMLPLVAVWMTMGGDTSRRVRALGVLVAALAAFLIANPLSIWDLPAFLNGFAVAASPAGLGLARVDLLQQLLWAMQWPGMILAFAGVTLAVVRAITGPGHTRWTLLASFPVVYFAVVAWHGATSDAVLLPLLPSVSVLAAIAVVSGVSLLRRFDIPRAARAALIAALTVVAVLPPAVFAIELVRQAGHEAGRH